MKLLISEIIDYILGIGPMYNAPNFIEILRLNDKGSFVSVFNRILQKSFNEYELKYPLFMWDKTIYVRNNMIREFTDNYENYLKGEVGEEYLELIPTSVVHYTDGLLRAYRDFTYVMPRLKIPRTGTFKISYFTKYPMRLTKDEHKDEYSKDAHVYGISTNSGPDFTYLMYIIEYNLLLYLRDQKAQMSYIDLPIEFYQNLETRISEIQTDINDWYQNPVWYAKLYI